MNPYFKLAWFDHGLMCWRDGRTAYPTYAEARAAATAAGTYRVSIVGENGRHDCEPFVIESTASARPPRKPPPRSGPRRRPGPWNTWGRP